MRRVSQVLISGLVGAIALAAASISEAEQLRAEGKIDEAQQHLQQLIATQPEFAQARYELGTILIEKGEFEAAQEQFTQTQELGSASLALTGQGRILLAQEKAAEAIVLFNQAQAEAPSVEELMNQVNVAEGEEAKAQARAEAAKHADLYYHRGLAGGRVRDYGTAAADLEAAIKLDPSNAKAHYYAGLSYNVLKRPDLMVSHFQRYLTMEPESPEAARVRSVLRGVR